MLSPGDRIESGRPGLSSHHDNCFANPLMKRHIRKILLHIQCSWLRWEPEQIAVSHDPLQDTSLQPPQVIRVPGNARGVRRALLLCARCSPLPGGKA